MKALFFTVTCLLFNLGFGQSEIEINNTKRHFQLRIGQLVLDGYNENNSSMNPSFSLSEFMKNDSLELVSYPTLASENEIFGKVLSYRFNLVDSNRVQEITIEGNSLSAVKDLIKNSKPGCFVLFSDIKVSIYDKLMYLPNYSSKAAE